jgi:glutathione S-transferase
LKNPLGKVPTLETESGDYIYESLIVADYLDEKYPETPLHSRDPMQKAKDRILIDHFPSASICFMSRLHQLYRVPHKLQS